MAENTENLVLRTVYLAADVDRRLKRLAFSQGITKNELIRTILRDGLVAYDGEAIGERLEVARPAPSKPKVSRSAPKLRVNHSDAALEPAE